MIKNIFLALFAFSLVLAGPSFSLIKKGEENKYTDEDKNLVKDIYMRAAKCFMDAAVNQVNNTGIPDTFGLTISYDIEEKES